MDIEECGETPERKALRRELKEHGASPYGYIHTPSTLLHVEYGPNL